MANILDEDRAVALWMFEQGFRDVVVMDHDKPKNPVQMVDAFKAGLVPIFGAPPHQGKPFAWLYHLRANEKSGNEAIEFTDQHRLLVESEEFLFKLLQLT